MLLLLSPLTQSERQLWKAMLLCLDPITGLGLPPLPGFFPSPSRKHSLGLSGKVAWGGGPHSVLTVMGVFPGQLSAVTSLFLWNPSQAESEKPLSLGITVGKARRGGLAIPME